MKLKQMDLDNKEQFISDVEATIDGYNATMKDTMLYLVIYTFATMFFELIQILKEERIIK